MLNKAEISTAGNNIYMFTVTRMCKHVSFQIPKLTFPPYIN